MRRRHDCVLKRQARFMDGLVRFGLMPNDGGGRLALSALEPYELRADHVVLALGHSARDTFAMLHARGVYLEAKPFSLGFRIE
ncbi:hypothetical protein K7B09_11500, partial [Thermomonas sp. RSS23]|nr:hypothetical protein [Thermomonas beijingensis]